MTTSLFNQDGKDYFDLFGWATKEGNYKSYNPTEPYKGFDYSSGGFGDSSQKTSWDDWLGQNTYDYNGKTLYSSDIWKTLGNSAYNKINSVNKWGMAPTVQASIPSESTTTPALIPSNPSVPTIKMPSVSTAGAKMPERIDALSKGIPNYFSAYKNLEGLPDKIDQWTDNAMNSQRVTGDQMNNILSKVSNQRAGSGIMGGTEETGLKAETLSNLAKIIQDNKNNIQAQGNSLKAQAISSLPGTAMQPVSLMASLYGQNANDELSWANLAAQMLNTSY